MDTQVITKTELSDNEVIQRVIAGEKNLFEVLMRKYNPRLYRIGMTIINNDSEIEDMMQNAYIKAYQNLDKFENRSSFSTWLVRILMNECLQHLKKSKHVTSLDGINTYNMDNNSMSKTSDYITPDNAAVNKELGKALERALLTLPEKYRMVFVLREIENMSVAETIDALELTESNVKVRLNRAKTMLRDKLNEYYKSDVVFPFHLTRCNRVVENVFQSLNK